MNEIKIDKIIRSKRRTISLSVCPDATLTVRAAPWISLAYIKDLVFKKRFWILKKKKQILERGAVKVKEFVEGEEFFYLGEKYKLKICDSGEIRLADALYFPVNFLGNARVKIISWYGERTREIIAKRAEYYSKITGWKFKSISVTGAARRWGSCSRSDSLNFSFRLAMVPPKVIDYVVAHELAHIPEKNHSARFWNRVGTVLPDYQVRRKWLRENERNLKI
jgi:hypothetical protein